MIFVRIVIDHHIAVALLLDIHRDFDGIGDKLFLWPRALNIIGHLHVRVSVSLRQGTEL